MARAAGGGGRLSDALSGVLSALRGVLGSGLHSVAVVGEASRPDDYVDGLSDVDVIAIVDSRPGPAERYELLRRLSATGLRLSVSYLRPGDLADLLRSGHPLGWQVARDSLILYDDGTLAGLLREVGVTLNERTAEALLRASLSALCIAAESYLRGYLSESAYWLHRSLRQAAQRLCLIKLGDIPRSDAEIDEALISLGAPPAVRACFSRLAAARRMGISNLTVRALVASAVRSLCLLLDLSSPDWALVEAEAVEAMASGPLVRIGVSVEGRRLRWRVLVADSESESGLREVVV